MNTPMKILLLGDYSNYSVALGAGLERLGHEVTVMSNGSFWLDTSRDIDISRSPGRIGGLKLWLRLLTVLAPKMRGYDVVGINSPVCVNLRPRRAQYIFDRLRRHNKGLFLLGTGADTCYVEEAMDLNSEVKYNEWRLFDRLAPHALETDEWRQWLDEPLNGLCHHVYDSVDGATAALYEYHVAFRRWLPASKVGYAGIPIDTSALLPVGMPDKIDKVKIFLGRHSRRLAEKGTDMLEAAARAVVEKYPDKAELVIVEDRPYAEYVELLRNSHVVLDQVYSYTPATNALLAMSYGKVAVSGAEPEFYDFIGERDNRPVFNAPPDYESLKQVLCGIVERRDELPAIGRASRDFVVKHNDVKVVASRVAGFWLSKLADKI